MFLLTFIFSSRSSPPWLWPVLGAAAGVYVFYRGFQLLQRKRLIMNTPVSKIRSAAMGLVEVSGLASGPYTVTAPITGVPCYYYRTMVWQWKRQGKSSSWVKEADESLHVPFYLDDSTARVLVNPQGAEMDIHRDFQEEFSHSLFSSSLEIPANISGFLTAHGVDTSAKVKIEEYCIKPKNALFVLGTLASNPGIEISAVPVRTLPSTEKLISFNLGGLSLGSRLVINEKTSLTILKGGRSSPDIFQHWRAARSSTTSKSCRRPYQGGNHESRSLGGSGNQSDTNQRCRSNQRRGRSWSRAGAGTVRSASADGTHEGRPQPGVLYFVAEPASGGAVIGLEVGTDDLGRSGGDAGVCLHSGTRVRLAMRYWRSSP